MDRLKWNEKVIERKRKEETTREKEKQNER